MGADAATPVFGVHCTVSAPELSGTVYLTTDPVARISRMASGSWQNPRGHRTPLLIRMGSDADRS